MAQNMYRVGDYVYFDTFPTFPYQIRRIEELNKIANGQVEAKVACFYRRRQLPQSLLKIADQAERQDQILSRPRRRLLTSSNHAEASTSNGDGKSEAKENGVCSNEKNESNGNSIAAEVTPQPEKKSAFAGLPLGAEKLSAEELHVIRQHELFRVRETEVLLAANIRGKCTVVLLSEVETCDMYLNQEDSFFYSLVYDPTTQTLLADKGKIEVGDRYQANVEDMLSNDFAASFPTNAGIKTPKSNGADDNKENGDLLLVDEEDEESSKDTINGLTNGTTNGKENREFAVFHPYHKLTDREIDQFLIVARAVGTFSRALDSSSTMKIPSLHMTTAAASRDVTILHAMALLHQADYDIGQATKFLVPPPSREHYPLEVDKLTCNNTISLGGPLLIRDQLEEWSASETALFEEALSKSGKDFHDIRSDYLPWKSPRDIIEFYYMWKTTARFAEKQKSKFSEQENKLKQVYIPNYNKANPNMIGPVNNFQIPVKSPIACESCKTNESVSWFAWGPATNQMRLCNDCWTQWKKQAGIKIPHENEHYDLDLAPEQSQNHLGRSNNSKNGSAGSNRSGLSTGNGGAVSAGGGRNSNTTTNIGFSNANINNKSQFQRGVAPPGVGGIGGHNVHINKSRLPFFLNTTLQTRVARRIAPRSIFDVRKSARLPFKLIDQKLLLNNYFNRGMPDILRAARQVRKGQLNHMAIDQLDKIHQRHHQRPRC